MPRSNARSSSRRDMRSPSPGPRGSAADLAEDSAEVSALNAVYRSNPAAVATALAREDEAPLFLSAYALSLYYASVWATVELVPHLLPDFGFPAPATDIERQWVRYVGIFASVGAVTCFYAARSGNTRAVRMTVCERYFSACLFFATGCLGFAGFHAAMALWGSKEMSDAARPLEGVTTAAARRALAKLEKSHAATVAESRGEVQPLHYSLVALCVAVSTLCFGLLIAPLHAPFPLENTENCIVWILMAGIIISCDGVRAMGAMRTPDSTIFWGWIMARFASGAQWTLVWHFVQPACITSVFLDVSTTVWSLMELRSFH